MKFCCASNVAIKNLKIARKKINFFTFFFQSLFSQKLQIFENITYIFGFYKFFPSLRLLIYLFRSNHKAMNQLFPT